jgi:hypothetical protein
MGDHGYFNIPNGRTKFSVNIRQKIFMNGYFIGFIWQTTEKPVEKKT